MSHKSQGKAMHIIYIASGDGERRNSKKCIYNFMATCKLHHGTCLVSNCDNYCIEKNTNSDVVDKAIENIVSDKDIMQSVRDKTAAFILNNKYIKKGR